MKATTKLLTFSHGSLDMGNVYRSGELVYIGISAHGDILIDIAQDDMPLTMIELAVESQNDYDPSEQLIPTDFGYTPN